MNKDVAKEEIQGFQLVLNDHTPVVFTNQVLILSANQEEIEIGLCVKGPDNRSSKVTHRLISTTSHFHRMADMFKKFSDQIMEEEKNKK